MNRLGLLLILLMFHFSLSAKTITVRKQGEVQSIAQALTVARKR